MKTQIKKLLSILTLIAILATAFYTVPVSAAELNTELLKETVENMDYMLNEEADICTVHVEFEGDWAVLYQKEINNGASDDELEQVKPKLLFVVGYLGKEKVVTIPTEINGQKVTKICDFQSANPIKTLKIHKGIELIDSTRDFVDVVYNDFDPSKIFFAEIEEFEVAKENKYFTSKDGVLFSKELDRIIHYPRAKKDKTFVIPAQYVTPESYDIPFNEYIDYNPYLEAIEVEKNHPSLSSKDGVLYDKKMTELLYYPKNKKDKSFIIPKTVTRIGWFNDGGGLDNHKYLENLTITENVYDVSGCDFGPEIIPKKVIFKNTKINSNSFDFGYEDDIPVGPFIGIRADVVYCYKNSPIHKLYQKYLPEQKIEFIEPETKTPANISSKNETTKKPTASKVESNTSSEALLETESDVNTIIDTENTESEITTIGTNESGESNTQENNPKNKSKVWIYIISAVVVLALSGGGFFVFKKFKK